MPYILIAWILIPGSSAAITSIEMRSQESCEVAGKAHVASLRESGMRTLFGGFSCVRRF